MEPHDTKGMGPHDSKAATGPHDPKEPTGPHEFKEMMNTHEPKGMTDPHDPKGLIRESYRIEGITAPECRSIFFDWALSLPVDADTTAAVRALLAHYGAQAPDHPMTQTLTGGLAGPAAPRRKGGRAGRVGPL